MKKLYSLLFLLLTTLPLFSQEGFRFDTDKKKITIPFQISNNLIVIPVYINGVNLNFLLDTGVEKTILFSLDNADSLQFNDIERIKIKGLGDGIPIEAFHSKRNKIAINGLVDNNHEVYVILDQEINFSSQLGITVNGILGYHFFKNHFIEINYQKKKVNIFPSKEDFSQKKLNKYQEIPLSIELEKPYIEAFASMNNKEIKTKLLVDTGSSDALWLFENENIKCPQNYFDDFLGRGFSGNIYGKRSRIDKLKLGEYDIIIPTISFPEVSSLQNVNMVVGRNGSVGGEIFKRFDVIFDYPNKKVYLKKNLNFDDPFNYNMSGVDFQHSGLQWIEEKVALKTEFVGELNTKLAFDDRSRNVKYQFALKPVYEISNVRKNSPGDLAGIQKGDLVQKINGKIAFNYKLYEINDLMQSDEGRWVTIEVERKGKPLKFKFQLKKIL